MLLICLRPKCCWCSDSRTFVEKKVAARIISHTDLVYLVYQSYNSCTVVDELLLVPVSHIQSASIFDEDIQSHIRNYQKCLVKLFDDEGKAPIFMETVNYLASTEKTILGGGAHACVDVIPVDVPKLEDSKV
eukprot:GHVL01000320.1.p1 GENE.GHVL01000320.1~~GHVL01000320.1.p1  ORF type:complete len:132 (-),score=22.04 GHVL01000320.1:242-637(-)